MICYRDPQSNRRVLAAKAVFRPLDLHIQMIPRRVSGPPAEPAPAVLDALVTGPCVGVPKFWK